MKRNTLIGKIIGSLTAAVVAAAMITSTLSFSASAGSYDTKYGTVEINPTDWMAGLPDDIKVNELSIPGAHDASTKNVDYFMEDFAQTQNGYISDLLEMGVRYFDLRICRDKGTLYMCHGSIDCYDSEDYRLELSDVIGDMEAFLFNHPSETILLQVKCDRDKNDAVNATYDFFKNMDDKAELYHGDHAPTLGEVRGNFILLNRLNYGKSTQDKFLKDSENGRCRYWGIDVHDFYGGNKEEKTLALTSDCKQMHTRVYTEDMYDVPRASKWDYVYNSLMGPHNAAYYRDTGKNEGMDTFNIIYSSMSYQDWARVILDLTHPFFNILDTICGGDVMVWPKDGVSYINPKLRELLENHPNLYTGCLVCDYIDDSLARDIYITNYDVTPGSSVGYTGSW